MCKRKAIVVTLGKIVQGIENCAIGLFSLSFPGLEQKHAARKNDECVSVNYFFKSLMLLMRK